MIFALVGNQNCGKTTLFNQLTGSNQHVGNFPGVTVDSKEGVMRGAKGCSVVDLPGIYSLRPYTAEEIVTRDFILNQKPDGIINIVDATNIERNLYLTLQLLEMQIPMVLALNMMDEVRGNGGTIDVQKMSDELGIPVVPIAAAKNEGIEELVDSAVRAARTRTLPKRVDFCDDGPVHRCIHAVSHLIEDHAQAAGMARRFAATKLIEGDEDIISRLLLNQNELEMVEHSIVEMEDEGKLDRNAAIASMRYDYIERLCSKTVVKCRESREHLRSVRIDRVLTNKYAALPIFVGIMLLIFWLTFDVVGAGLQDLLALGISRLSAVVDHGLTAYGMNPVVHSLIIDGIFAGVGSVVSFLPIIVVMFFFLSILEDTGYMARVAFVMDKLLRKIGLSGRSFVPMLIGFGCTVPAVMATRTLPSARDRRLTILLTPFMSCSAKIPIYAVFTAAFFPQHAVLAMALLYFGGMVVGVLISLLLNHTVFRGNPVPFVMELPNYRLPGAKNVAQLLWEKAKDFLQNLIREKDMPPKPTLDIDISEFRHMRSLMIKVQDRAKEIKHLQDKVLPDLKQQFAEAKGIFKGKERKALEVQIQQTEKEIADKLDKIPDTLKADGYPNVQAFMATFRKMEGVVEQYNRELAEWERKVKENSRPGKKERYAPPERKSVRDTLRRLQAEGKQHRTRKKSHERER